MRNDENIQNAIKRFLSENNISQTDLARKLNVKSQTINQYISGKTVTIKDIKFIQLYPYIKNYLPENYSSYWEQKLTDRFGSVSDYIGVSPTIQPISKVLSSKKPKVVGKNDIYVPLLNVKSAKYYEPSIESLSYFLENNKIGDEIYRGGNGKSSIVALKIEADSTIPYPEGTIIFVDTNNPPQNGDHVIARLQDKGIVFKEYYRKNEIVYLFSVNQDGENYEWSIRENPGYSLFIWPCLSAYIGMKNFSN